MVAELQVHLQSYIDKLDPDEVFNTLNTRNELADQDGLEEENGEKNLDKDTNPTTMTSLKVKVDLVKGLRGHREDTEAMRLQVLQTTRKEKKKVWSTCVLLSVDAQEATFFSKNVAQLPLCLISGDNILGRQLLTALQHRFDCVIFPLELPEDELMWMSTLWSSIPPPILAQNTAAAPTNNKR